MAKAHTVVDDFNDNQRDTALWLLVNSPDLVRETNGRLEIRPRSNQAMIYGYATNATNYDFTDSEARVEVVRAITAPGGATGLSVSALGVGFVLIGVIDGRVECMQSAGGVVTVLHHVPYDPVAHRWLRLSERAGITRWETSATGEEWTMLHQAADPIPLTSVYLQLAVTMTSAQPSPGVAIFDNFNVGNTSLSRRVEARRRSARDVRVQAAEVAAARPHDEHANNNDEVNYPTRPLAGNFSKSLPHDSFGDVDPAAYASLLRALESRDPQDFEEITLASSTAVKLTNPQAGLTFDIAGPDAQERTIPPAPRFDSEVTAHEAGELYWMAVLRELPFASYASDTVAAAAIASLNNEFPQFGGTGPVTGQNLFRGIYPGEQVGPYVSQLLLKGNVDPRKPAGQGRDATDGFISYGSRTIDQRLFPAPAFSDYLKDFATWLNVQNGADTRGTDSFETTKRFIRNLRGGTTFVHFDQVLDAYYNAAWILMTEPTGNQLAFQSGVTGRAQIDLEFPKNDGNPYDPPGTAMDARKQVGFATFGPTHLLQVLGEVFNRALRAVWYQKWFVHRRLRPEEYGGRVHNQVLFNTSGGAEGRSYPLHSSIVTSLQSGGLAPYYGNTGELFPQSYLLPQAYPEGAPTHPAYGAGHATGSGACVTILKAFFDEDTPIENPVQSQYDGLTLIPYTGADAGQMTVGGELNKLAGNIAIFRNAAGVHWRSDYTESLPFGESVAIGLLQEMSLGFNEDDAFFELTRFDGQKIRIFDGKVVPVVP